MKRSPKRCGSSNESDWTEVLEGLASAVIVRVKQPEIEHRVSLRDFRNWLDAGGRSPAEMALKSRLRQILARS
jgi:hypothetical protein